LSGLGSPAGRGEIVAAGQGLGLLRSELNREVVSALAECGPMTRSDLRAWLVIGSPSTIGKCVDGLVEMALLTVTVRPGRVREFALTSAGHDLAALVRLADAWLASHPRRNLAHSSVGWRAFGAAADGWHAAILDRVLRRSTPPDVLNREIQGVSERRLKADLATLAGVGLVEVRRARGGRRHYRITEWGRRFVGVIVSIARWERSHLGDRAAPFEIDDAILALVTVMQLLRLPLGLRGSCTLTVELDRGVEGSPRAGALWARLGGGRVLEWGEGAAPSTPDAWASGPVDAWLAALVDGRSDALRGGGGDGGPGLAESVIAQLHAALFGYQKD
jgi:DNA-binding HxlR family transcriptional regulator